MQECGAISTKYACSNAANCTNNELAVLQWGSSGVTLNPLYSLPSDPYTPVANTVINWGSYGFADLTVAPEYSVYGSTLNTTQTKRVVSNFTEYYGLNSTYNAARLMQAVFNKNDTVLQIFGIALEQNTSGLQTVVQTLRALA